MTRPPSACARSWKTRRKAAVLHAPAKPSSRRTTARPRWAAHAGSAAGAWARCALGHARARVSRRVITAHGKNRPDHRHHRAGRRLSRARLLGRAIASSAPIAAPRASDRPARRSSASPTTSNSSISSCSSPAISAACSRGASPTRSTISPRKASSASPSTSRSSPPTSTRLGVAAPARRHARCHVPKHASTRPRPRKCSARRRRCRRTRARRSIRAAPMASPSCSRIGSTINYREAYGLLACSGILFNHEIARCAAASSSPARSPLGSRAIALGQQDALELGNLEAQARLGLRRRICRRHVAHAAAG